MASAPTYTRAQLSLYFERIALPEACRFYNVDDLLSSSDPGRPYYQLQYLQLILKHHQVRIPWENLTQHYSWHRTVHVSPNHLLDKFAGNRSTTHCGDDASATTTTTQSRRGGYCMENNTLFVTVLRSLGFKAYLGPSRVWDPTAKRYGGFTHCVVIVTIDSSSEDVDDDERQQRYMVDVGYGANGPTTPLPLPRPSVTTTTTTLELPPLHRESTSLSRLRYDSLPHQHTDPNQRVWIHEIRDDDAAAGRNDNSEQQQPEWTPTYCFLENEVFPEDIAVFNLHPMTSRHTFFTQKVVATRFTTNLEAPDDHGPFSSSAAQGVPDEGAIIGGDIDGALILFGDSLKWRRTRRRGRGRSWEYRLKSEGERLDALRRYFGIELDGEEREAILGTVGAIRG